MKKLIILFLLLTSLAYGQETLDKTHQYTYHNINNNLITVFIRNNQGSSDTINVYGIFDREIKLMGIGLNRISYDLYGNELYSINTMGAKRIMFKYASIMNDSARQTSIFIYEGGQINSSERINYFYDSVKSGSTEKIFDLGSNYEYCIVTVQGSDSVEVDTYEPLLNIWIRTAAVNRATTAVTSTLQAGSYLIWDMFINKIKIKALSTNGTTKFLIRTKNK